MKKGFWNYLEPVTYTVVIVKFLEVHETPMHWQNAFIGECGQAVLVRRGEHTFLMDNRDGSGLLKMEKRGGPHSMHRSIGGYEIVNEDVPEAIWQHFDEHKRLDLDSKSDSWQKEHHPEQWKQLQDLKAGWAASPMNPKNMK